MKILVTGSGGFVGGSFSRFAAKTGHQVLGVTRKSQPDRDWTGLHLSLDVAQSDMAGAIRDFAPDVIFHAAGAASVGASISAPLDDFRAAAATWANVLDSARRSGLKPLLLFPSSAAVYGNPSSLPIAETAPIAPISPYGFHKAMCETLAREYAQCFGFSVIVCRIFSLFGPSQRRLLVWELAQKMLNPDPIVWLEGDGTESRDYLSIDDASSALLHLIGSALAFKPPGAGLITVNLASGREIGILDLAGMIRNISATDKQIRCRGAARPGDPRRWRADVTALTNLAPAWKPQPFEASVRTCIDQWTAE